MSKKVTIGILSFKDQKYLEQGLPSLLTQTYSNIEILVCDNNQDPNNTIKSWINQNFPTIKVLNAGGNVGFGNGHNYLMQKASGDFYLCFNSDMFASPTFVAELLQGFKADPKAAVVTGKLLKWSNFPLSPNKLKQNYIDTAGIIPFKSHYFAERAHGQKDLGQFNKQVEIWGCSGASPMFKMELLQKVQHSNGEFFDKNFFMYKEDIDLMYRLRWAGYTCIYQPTAVAWHDRTAENPGGIFQNIKKRRNRALYIKYNSYLNQLILTYKNWSSGYTLKTKLKTFSFLLKYTLYLLFFDPKVLKAVSVFLKLKPAIKLQRVSMPRAISPQKMETWFQ